MLRFNGKVISGADPENLTLKTVTEESKSNEEPSCSTDLTEEEQTTFALKTSLQQRTTGLLEEVAKLSS